MGPPEPEIRQRYVACLNFFARVFLVKVQASRAILLHSSSDSFGGVWELGPAINRDDAARTGHLEFMVGVMWHRVESSERSSPEQCLIITAKGDDVED